MKLTLLQTVVAVVIVSTLNELYPERGAAVLDTPLADLAPASLHT